MPRQTAVPLRPGKRWPWPAPAAPAEPAAAAPAAAPAGAPQAPPEMDLEAAYEYFLDRFKRDLAAFPRELLTAVTIVLDQPLRGEPRDHLADRGRGDAQALRQITGRDGALVAVQLVEGLEIVLLAAREGTPNWSYWTAYHNL